MITISTSDRDDKKAEQLVEREYVAPKTLYAAISEMGEEELHRPVSALWFSAITAGLAMGTSPMLMGALYHAGDGTSASHLITALGYPVGSILIAIARLQLFTENTLTAVLPVTRNPGLSSFKLLLRLWGVVLLGNMVGAIIVGLAYPAILPGDAMGSVISAVSKIGERGPLENLVSAIPAGFLIGLLAWSLPSVGQQRILTVFIVTYLVGAGGFPRIIAGTVETTVLLVSGNFALADALGFILPVLIGNTLGGAALFAGLAYGQVREEVEH